MVGASLRVTSCAVCTDCNHPSSADDRLGEGAYVTALDDLQSAAHTTRDGLDTSAASAADLQKQTEDLAGQFAALGNEGSAQVLAQSAAPRLATVREHMANAQQELDAYVQDCEQAKG